MQRARIWAHTAVPLNFSAYPLSPAGASSGSTREPYATMAWLAALNSSRPLGELVPNCTRWPRWKTSSDTSLRMGVATAGVVAHVSSARASVSSRLGCSASNTCAYAARLCAASSTPRTSRAAPMSARATSSLPECAATAGASWSSTSPSGLKKGSKRSLSSSKNTRRARDL